MRVILRCEKSGLVSFTKKFNGRGMEFGLDNHDWGVTIEMVIAQLWRENCASYFHIVHHIYSTISDIVYSIDEYYFISL